MVKSFVFAIIGFFIIIGIMKVAIGIHWPLLAIMSVAFGIGFLNPEKGWQVAIFLSFCLLLFGLTFEKLNLKPDNNNLTHFICNIAILPILFGGYMGGYFKKALKQ
jgi:hypothetical protein